MKKILIINIDANYRCLYSVLVASALLNINNKIKISLVCSKDSEEIGETGIFDDIHFLDSKNIAVLESSKKEMLKFLAPLANKDWDYVVNLSTHPLAAIFTTHLRFQDMLGLQLEEGTGRILSNDFFSNLLAGYPVAAGKYPCHITYIYYGVLGHYDSFTALSTVWNRDDVNELAQKFDVIKKQTNKNKIICIDSSIKKNGRIDSLNFVINLYKKIHESNYLPIIVNKNSDDDSFIINRLRDSIEGEIYVVTVSPFAQLSLLSNVDLVVTSDLNLKTMADLSFKPSVLMIEGEGENLPLNDFSINSHSYLLKFPKYNNEIIDLVSNIYSEILGGIVLELKNSPQYQVYKTISEQNIPFLKPLTSGGKEESDEFTKWWLHLRYVIHLHKQHLPRLAINKKAYLSAINGERENIKKGFNGILTFFKEKGLDTKLSSSQLTQLESNSALLAISLKFIKRTNDDSLLNGASLLKQMKPLVTEMTSFLDTEEESLDSI